ncbi:phospholipase C [Sinomonas susongensis]|uniref:phospholipase C n=1 Tax=Sinomonas susongensis TaxID=1324851 RepID=UPI00148736B6|nr:alkaline phosphatase family protein [Sinomonas susongensis]
MPKFSIRAAAATSAFGLAIASAGAVAAALPAQASSTSTPIKHVVVIFGENVSFDHYFATYPNAANTPGETTQGSGAPAPSFTAAPNTPKGINTLANAGLLAPNNPNSVQPSRLTPSQAVTCDQGHAYTQEQKAYDGGLMDKFVQNTSTDTCGAPRYQAPGLTMDYYDGNTVTGMWNYAQHFAMSDNSYSDTFGPSTPGALNLVSGQTHGVTSINALTGQQTSTPDSYTVKSPNAQGVGTVTGDPDPAYDDCSDNSHNPPQSGSLNALAAMQGKNVGDLLNAQGVSWGWFQGGFTPQGSKTISGTSYAQCTASHTNVAGISSTDYSPHHEPFQYFASTANPHHLPPASDAEIGHNGQANHQYDMTAFDKVVNSDNMPAVSFLKAPEYQDGHASYSDPIDEQKFVVNEINAIQKSKNWESTAIVLAYDDSDGWYDHSATKVLNASNDPANDAAWCLNAAAAGTPILNGYQDRCGPGPRQPLLVVSPYAKRNFVDHTVTQQSSILSFIEDNWNLGRIGNGSFDQLAGSLGNLFDFSHPRRDGLILNPANGTVVQAPYCAGNKGQHLGEGGSCS